LKADLHSHSTVSDGRLSPQALVERAAQKGLGILALTDHDNTAGVAAATEAARRLGLRVIPGVEISADFEPGTMHILGLGIDIHNALLQGKLAQLQKAREERNPKIVERLRLSGVEVTYAEIQAEAKGGQIGRPHFAQVLLDKGVVASFEEAFDRYLAKGAPAYVPKARMQSGEAIQAIHAAAGLAVLAHPLQLRLEGPALESLLLKLKAEGLDGIEVFHSDHDLAQTQFIAELAKRHGLKVSGGSDFHGIPGKQVELGVPELPESLVEELFA
jgi:predicted metal-dependent phosphoesterase TrpH